MKIKYFKTIAQACRYTGATGELVFVKEDCSLRVHDGCTCGGKILNEAFDAADLIARIEALEAETDNVIVSGTATVDEITLTDVDGGTVVIPITHPPVPAEEGVYVNGEVPGVVDVAAGTITFATAQDEGEAAGPPMVIDISALITALTSTAHPNFNGTGVTYDAGTDTYTFTDTDTDTFATLAGDTITLANGDTITVAAGDHTEVTDGGSGLVDITDPDNIVINPLFKNAGAKGSAGVTLNATADVILTDDNVVADAAPHAAEFNGCVLDTTGIPVDKGGNGELRARYTKHSEQIYAAGSTANAGGFLSGVTPMGNGFNFGPIFAVPFTNTDPCRDKRLKFDMQTEATLTSNGHPAKLSFQAVASVLLDRGNGVLATAVTFPVRYGGNGHEDDVPASGVPNATVQMGSRQNTRGTDVLQVFIPVPAGATVVPRYQVRAFIAQSLRAQQHALVDGEDAEMSVEMKTFGYADTLFTG